MRVKFRKQNDGQTKSLTIDKVYEVIGIEGDSYRIVCDEGEPYLYEPEQFEIIDPKQPEIWVKELGADGELYAYPMAWFHGCFFERYFDKEPGFSDAFWEECYRIYGIKKNA